MIKEVKKYPIDFAFLFLGLGGLGYVFLNYSHSPALQKKIILVGGVFYLLWGTVHHLVRDDFCWRTFLEYLLVALIAIGAAFLILNWV